mmetsp:Transcript_24737/g.24267  ORF Transcript_24737/g.24267 Transcript_24737/m.24267 type:complete len:123 (-) Transcript_24737:461-829(-)
MLYVLHPDNSTFKEVAKYGKVHNSEELKARFPAMNIPSYLKGVFDPEGGVVMVKEALQATKDLAIKHGANLKYNAKVDSIDHEKGEVTMEDGKTYRGKTIVIACGIFSPKFQKTPNQFKSYT